MFRSIITRTFPFFHRMTRKYCLILAISLWFSYCSPKMRQTGRPAYNQATRQYIQFTWSLVALFDTPEVEGRGEWYIPQAHKTITIAVAPR